MSTAVIPRTAYTSYRHRQFNWQVLFDEIDQGYTQIAVAHIHNVPPKTLSWHYRKYVAGNQNKDQNMIDEAVGRSDGRKRSHRALTDAEEEEIHREYKSQTENGVAVSNDDLSTLAICVYDDDHPHHTRSHTFAGSARFVKRYKHDYHMSTGLVKRRHRPPSYPTEDQRWSEATDFLRNS